jgi:hypothetical protein
MGLRPHEDTLARLGELPMWTSLAIALGIVILALVVVGVVPFS